MLRFRRARRFTATLLATTALTGVMIAPAGAITNGELDGNGHPYVGILVAQDANGSPLWRCTGTLMSPTVFMTAGHCTETPAAQIEIWFSAGPVPVGAGYPATTPGDRCDGISGYPCTGDVGGTPYTHPQYDPNAFFLHDLGVIVLDAPIVMSSYGALPALDSLDALKPSRHTTLTAVGYGLQKSFPDAAAWKDSAIRQRMVARPHLLQINKGIVGDYALLLSNNANSGGTCFGDSGGPNFLGDSNVVAAVTSFGINPTCGGTGGVYRVDRADDVTWLATFGIAP